MKKLSSTTFALLGLLSRQPWSAYGFAKYMQTSFIRMVWPRAESSMYSEPNKLVERGYASSRQEQINNRLRTVYEITDEGREALDAWLDEPAAHATIEHESMLKLALTEFTNKERVLRRIEEIENQTKDAMATRQLVANKIEKEGFHVPAQSPANVFGILYLNHMLRAQEQWAIEARNLLNELPAGKNLEELHDWSLQKYLDLINPKTLCQEPSALD